MEKLKEVKIENLSKEEIIEHRKNVLSLEKEQIVEYLKFAIDTFYKTEDEGDNNKSVEMFFDTEDFKSYYDEILNSDD